MSVIRTDEWLKDYSENPIKICERLEKYFPDAQSREIYKYLISHGMSRSFGHEKNQLEGQVWRMIQKEEQQLQALWDGPNVPIFIFPSDTKNSQLKRDTNGKSGLAFKDKLFLFISEDNNEKEIKSLLTHEYNHTCRLSNLDAEEYTLLDSIILEGLAENAVRERYGEEFVASWTSYYSSRQLERMWKKLIYPNIHLTKKDPKHDRILYGLGLYPKMLGYSVGYYLVQKYNEERRRTSKNLLNLKAGEIAQIST